MPVSANISSTINRVSTAGTPEEIYSVYYSSSEMSNRLVLILHDYFDYHKRYRDFAKYVVSELNFDVCLFDYRGFGMSGGKRGQIKSVESLSRDLETVLIEIRKNKSISKITLMGVGLGGLVSVDFLLNRKKNFCNCEFSQILINPFLKMKISNAQMLETFLGETFHLKQLMPMYKVFENNSDIEEAEKLFADPLAIKEIDPTVIKSIKSKAEDIKRNLYFIEDKTLLLIGAHGKICDNYMVKLFNKAMPVRYSELIEYDESGHDLLHDVERERVTKDILQWLKKLS